MILAPREIEFLHFHLFAGLGGGAKGFNAGRVQVGHARARFRCIGGVDVNAAAIADFGRLAGVHGTVLDLFNREQYIAFHGHEPPDDWREAQPDDLRRAAHAERPHIIFGSAPCKGFSGALETFVYDDRGEDRDSVASLDEGAARLVADAGKAASMALICSSNAPAKLTRDAREA